MREHLKNLLKKQNRGAVLLIACFFLLLAGPNLIAPILGGYDESSAEKRELASLPVLSLENLMNYPGEMDAYLGDHAAFRNFFLSLNAVINDKLFGYADSGDVVRGKDGWLFFTGGTALKDVLGLNRFSPEDLEYINSCVKTAADYYQERGIDFIVLLPPNKSSVYRRYLPKGYELVSETTKGEELAAYLAEHSGVPVLAPLDSFLEDTEHLWYYKTDTHWNDVAGFLASQQIIGALGGTPTPLSDVTVSCAPCEPGDLADLFHLPHRFAEDVSATVSGYYDSAVLRFDDVNGDGGIVRITNETAPDSRRIAFFRDSFGLAVQNSLPKYFRNTDFYHWQYFDTSLLEETPPDAIVYEIVEREMGRIPDDMHALAPAAFSSS